MVARPETPPRRAGDPVRAAWEVADLVHGLFAARDEATVLARLRSALADRVPHDALAIHTLDLELEEASAAGQALRRRRAVLVPDDPEPRMRLVGSAPPRPTRIGIPLLADGAPLGAVELDYERGFADDEIETALRLCDSGSLALANAREREALRASAGALQPLGRLAEVAERVAAAAASLAGLDGTGVFVDDGGLAAAAGSLRDEDDLELARSCAASGAPVVERGSGTRAALPLDDVGVLLVSAPELEVSALRPVEQLADHAASALANALLYESALRDNDRAVASSVESLANALEASDGETHEHARWIAEVSCRVARELGLDEAGVERVELSGLLHDIGKIGIGDAVLLKPGRLTAAERAVMRSHPELGERILAPIERLRDVRRIVRHCHERWDGEGYPDGLAGEEIPLESRIVFVCDAFHAMTSDRPYRKALRRSEAVRRLRAGAGTQFDPRVVDATLAVLAG